MGRPKINVPRVQVRMSEEMRAELKDRAKARFWGLNAEIIMLLERGLAAEKTASEPTA